MIGLFFSASDRIRRMLQGRFSKGVMERLCRQDSGLFPKPAEIRFSCTCPDYASMCKHVAAVLYGVGARLDEQPELLFRLRAVDGKELVARIDATWPAGKQAPSSGRVLASGDLSALFGLDIDAGERPASMADHGQPARCKRTGAKKLRQSNPDATQKTAARKGADMPGQGQAGNAASAKRNGRSGSSARRSEAPEVSAKVKRGKTIRKPAATDT